MKSHSLSQTLRDPAKNLLAFIFIVTFGLGLATNGLSALVWDALCGWLELRSGIPKVVWQVIITSTLIGSIVFWIYLSNLSLWFKFFLLKFGIGTVEPQETNVEPLKETFPGLIVVVSPTKNPPAEVAIKHHWASGKGQLRHCWLICGGDKSLAAAEQMVGNLAKQGILHDVKFHFGKDDLVRDPENPQQWFDLVPDVLQGKLADDPNHILRLVDAIYIDAQENYGLSPSQIIADYTGGTKSMSAGVILACTNPARNLQYIRSEYGENNEIKNSQVMEVKISYKLKPIRSASLK